MKIAGIILIVLGLGVFGYWAATGAEPVTKYQVVEETVTTDDFGDEVTSKTMKDEFRFGMLPDKGYDGALPVGGGLAGLGVVLLIAGVVRSRKNA